MKLSDEKFALLMVSITWILMFSCGMFSYFGLMIGFISTFIALVIVGFWTMVIIRD